MSYRYRLRNKTIKYKADMDKSIHGNTTVQLGQSVPTVVTSALEQSDVEGSLLNTATSTVVSVSVASAFVQGTPVVSPQQQAAPSGATALDDEVSGYFRSEPLPSTHFRYIPLSPSQPQQPMSCPSSHADSTTSFLETDYARSTDRAPAQALSHQSHISSRASSRPSRRSAVPDPVVVLMKSMFDRMSECCHPGVPGTS